MALQNTTTIVAIVYLRTQYSASDPPGPLALIYYFVCPFSLSAYVFERTLKYITQPACF